MSRRGNKQRARGDESDGCGWNSRPEISLLSSTRTVSGQGHCGGLLRDVTSFFLSFFMHPNTQQSPQRAELSTTHEGNIGAATLNALLHFVLSVLVWHYRLLSTIYRLFFLQCTVLVRLRPVTSNILLVKCCISFLRNDVRLFSYDEGVLGD